MGVLLVRSPPCALPSPPPFPSSLPAIFDYLEQKTSLKRFWWFVFLVLTVSATIFTWIGPLAVWSVARAVEWTGATSEDVVSREVVSRVHLLLLLSLLFALSPLVSSHVVVISNFICFVYPAYRTFKTLEGKYVAGHFEEVEENQSIEVHRYWSDTYNTTQRQQSRPGQPGSSARVPKRTDAWMRMLMRLLLFR